MATPTTSDILRIAAVTNPALRNLQITACYSDLSLAMSAKTGRTANWCTFATWASRQAGQTIRGEDFRAKLKRELHLDPRVSAIFSLIGAIAKENGAAASIEEIKETSVAHLIRQVSTRSSEAVARGNKKVFEEIAFHFARFLEICATDQQYTQSSLDTFLEQLRTGDPPEGQRYLRQAFSRYYSSIFEQNQKKAAELYFLANLEIGFHEQTRLQPEIAEALNAAAIDPQQLLPIINALILPSNTVKSGFRRLLMWTLGKTGLLEKHVTALCQLTSSIIRKLLTKEMMTLTFPPGKTMLLGQDVRGKFPEVLAHLQQPDLLSFLKVVDPTGDSVSQSGAIDWADLKDRLHFICDLFRTSHQDRELFDEAFTKEEITLINEGKVPARFDW